VNLGVATFSLEQRLIGGGKRDRTADLLHAMQALSQLSYTPVGFALRQLVLLRCSVINAVQASLRF